MFENPRRGKQARNFTTNAPKIIDLKLSSEQNIFRKLPLDAPDVKLARHRNPVPNLTKTGHNQNLTLVSRLQ